MYPLHQLEYILLLLLLGKVNSFHVQCGQLLIASGDHPLMWVTENALAFI